MSDFENQMAEWRKTVWGTGPCQVPSQENFTLTDEERKALNRGIDALYGVEDVSDGACRRDDAAARTLLALLERMK
jgi:hypothetical protein